MAIYMEIKDDVIKSGWTAPLGQTGSGGSYEYDLNKYNTYLKTYAEKIGDMIIAEQQMISAVKGIFGVWSDENSELIYKMCEGFGSGTGFSNKIDMSFIEEAYKICTNLMKKYPTTASKYSEIKKYGTSGLHYSSAITQPSNRDKTRAFVNKNNANNMLENVENKINLVKRYMNEVNQAKIQFVNGQWGYKDSTYVPVMKNYNSIINEYNTFVTKFRSQVNSSIAKINLICNLTILK